MKIFHIIVMWNHNHNNLTKQKQLKMTGIHVAFNKKGEKKMIYISCWPWQSIGCDDHNLRVSVWYMGMYSLIHLFHASIYPHPHLVSVFALNLFLDYLNQLPLAPVKHRLAQVATSRLSDLDSWITASLWLRGEKKNTLLFIRGRNSCIRLQTVNLCYGTIYHRSNGVKSKARES